MGFGGCSTGREALKWQTSFVSGNYHPDTGEQIECLERYRDTQDNKVMDKERQWGRETMWIKRRGGGRLREEREGMWIARNESIERLKRPITRLWLTKKYQTTMAIEGQPRKRAPFWVLCYGQGRNPLLIDHFSFFSLVTFWATPRGRQARVRSGWIGERLHQKRRTSVSMRGGKTVVERKKE